MFRSFGLWYQERGCVLKRFEGREKERELTSERKKRKTKVEGGCHKVATYIFSKRRQKKFQKHFFLFQKLS